MVFVSTEVLYLKDFQQGSSIKQQPEWEAAPQFKKIKTWRTSVLFQDEYTLKHIEFMVPC